MALAANPTLAAGKAVPPCNQPKVATSYYQPAAAPSPTQPNCNTRYVQKFYYEPVTTYEQTSFYEPVTSYRSSYYYEPITTYHTSYYYDPSSCGYQAFSSPATSYQLKSQNFPVTSYSLKTAVNPVTSYKYSYYYEPQTTCCTTTVGSPILAGPAPCATPGTTGTPGTAPGVSEKATPTPAPAAAAPGVGEARDSAANGKGTGLGAPAIPNWTNPGFNTPVAPAKAPVVKLEKIVSISANNLQGQIVQASQIPNPGAQLILVHESIPGKKVKVSTDANGRFTTHLEEGNWLVYLVDGEGRALYQKQINIKPAQVETIRLVSR